MIERGSGRTSGLTNWHLMDLLSMWACIQDHDTAGHWKLVAGWRKVCDLALTHLSRLKEYRRGLAEAWPPATNAAARVYLAELDDLIDKVQRTHDAAVANHDALAAAARAISSTRTELKPLHDEYVEKLQQKRSYEATIADPKAVLGSRLPDKPVTDEDLERLNARARHLMYGLSSELQQAQAMLRQPPRLPRSGRDPSEQEAYSSAGATPVIPPIIPITLTGNEGGAPAPRSTRAQSTPTTIASPSESVVNSGPVLGGNATTLHPPVSATEATTPTPRSTTSSFPQFPPPGYTPSNKIAGTTTTIGGEISKPVSGDTSGIQHNKPDAPWKATPPSGVIGSSPVFPTTRPSSAAAARHVNPVGGVIGGGGAWATPAGAAGSRPGTNHSGKVGGLHRPPFVDFSNLHNLGRPIHNTAKYDNPEEGYWDPEHPWRTKDGVTPIMRAPDHEGQIDPGPAIGLEK